MKKIESKWKAISVYELLAFLFFSGLTFFFCLRGDYWFPILDSANLMFHEAGHPLMRLLSSHLEVYGGTLAQLFFPLVFALKFKKERATTSFAFSLLWFFENIFNIARYMRDARAQQLPLVGGEHDWTEILNRWNLISSDIKLASNLINASILGVIITFIWLYQQWNLKRKAQV